ncbi:Tryptophan 2,3-dioxygenase (plasmid) [Caballeronia sp. SBC1]|uniref:tryptophan 2,3-dioxygenase n=1 Tax=unclassified Caballeronia TaxID=2646786 RepID=UPI0013E199E4|nr:MULTISPECIES: tryptophan 2,3-dioxygenase [unclassified Caballeronia]QIE28505.1 Tryptophan 2,3-dioxygenase [Caballeronia sp. SBC2]QIN66562.1 Tryptophan 2,3-dioxygenase [Caballeronia sp. SBC1]
MTQSHESEGTGGCPMGYGTGAGTVAGAADDNAPKPEGWHDAQLDFAGSMSYGDYLSLDTLLSAQHPLSPDHNEMLFIVQHQTSELWMKLALYELHAALAAVRRDDLPPAFKMLARVSRILDQLVQAWSVLATMTPSEYTAMRPYLGASSGFQSHQYRQIEFLLGNKNVQMLKPHAHRPNVLAEVKATLDAPSFYDEVIRLLARRGFPIAPERLERDWTQPTTHDASVEAAWLTVYREPTQHWELYEMAEELVDLEDSFRQWRFRHVTTVERIIGFKQGTGGTSGAPYLRKMLDVVLFPELWHVRTLL